MQRCVGTNAVITRPSSCFAMASNTMISALGTLKSDKQQPARRPLSTSATSASVVEVKAA
jgi:hypothetical protein